MHVVVARDDGSSLPLRRTAFERLLAELGTWLPAEPLPTIVAAYMDHVGHEQASTERGAPAELRRRAPDGIEATHRGALDAVRSKLFSALEIAALSCLGGPYAIGVPTRVSDVTVVGT